MNLCRCRGDRAQRRPATTDALGVPSASSRPADQLPCHAAGQMRQRSLRTRSARSANNKNRAGNHEQEDRRARGSFWLGCLRIGMGRLAGRQGDRGRCWLCARRRHRCHGSQAAPLRRAHARRKGEVRGPEQAGRGRRDRVCCESRAQRPTPIRWASSTCRATTSCR